MFLFFLEHTYLIIQIGEHTAVRRTEVFSGAVSRSVGVQSSEVLCSPFPTQISDSRIIRIRVNA